MPKTIIARLQENPQYLKQKNGKPKKKVKFKKITFKISDTHLEAMKIICKRQKTTPIRYLKSVIRKQTARYKSNPAPVSYVTENQLQLFEMETEITNGGKKKKVNAG